MGGIPAIRQRLVQLKSDRMLSCLMGDYKGFKAAQKEFAKLAVKNFDDVLAVSTPQKVTTPLFSKEGFNLMKIWFLDKFRIKTPEEKELKRMAAVEKMRKKYLNMS